MDSQVEINAKMWGILIDWILEVHQKFDLMPESLYLTVYIIDMYLSLQSVLRRELQLVGVSALLIACNYEEIWAHEVSKKLNPSAFLHSPVTSVRPFLIAGCVRTLAGE